MRSAAAALSLHPVAAAALGEVAGDVLETLDHRPDLAVVIAGGAHAESLGAITEAVQDLLGPRCVLAVGAPGALGAGTAIVDAPSVALWAATDLGGEAVPLDVLLRSDAADHLPSSGTLLVVGAGGGDALAMLVSSLAERRSGLAVVGGLVDPTAHPRGRVGADGRTDDPLAAVVLPPGVATATSAGAVRLLGDPVVVTDADGPVVAALAGTPAADRLDEIVTGLAAHERRALQRGIFLCRVVNERGADPGPADVVAHGVRGLVAGTRSLAIDTEVEVGTLVRFGCLDADSADDELRRALRDASGLRPTAGALLFSCVARTGVFFDTDAHDAVVAAETLDTTAVAGAFCVGEIGPRGARSWLSGHTAATLVVHAEGDRALG